jgi:putative two-component system response regulator
MNIMISNNDILNARILIVDDNRTNVKLLEKILLTAGYTSVLGITDPRETVEIYKSYRPELILLDINMPHLDGYQVMELLKENGQAADYVPIMVLSASQDKETRIKSLKSGARDFLTKPFDHTEVLTRIHNMLEARLLHNQIRNQNVVLEQKVLERTKELSETNKDLEDFVYIISHDLKEPLFSIGGFTSRLLRVG